MDPAEKPGTRILIADDDADLLALVDFTLRHAGFEVVMARDGTEALEAFARTKPDLLILDINMPGADGFAVCEAVRAQSTLPVLMLSARDQESDMVRALESGADGYLTKPFSPRTLIARVRATLRRATPDDPQRIEVEGITLDIEAHAILHKSTQLHLTRLETRVLQILMTTAGRTVSAEKLVSDAWGRSGPEERHALKQVIYRLRRKLDAEAATHDRLQTTRSAGYRWLTDMARRETSPLTPIPSHPL